MLKQRALFAGHNPIVIEPGCGRPSLLEGAVQAVADLKQQLLTHGAILLRGFRVTEVGDFDDFVGAVSIHQFEYMYRSSPREWVTDKVHTSTSYPSRLDIPLHNENSYQRSWPSIVAFCCIEVAPRGGETPIASTLAVSQHIGPDLMGKFARLGVEYVRHYHRGIDLSWQQVFQTDSREFVQRYCHNNHIDCEWLENDILRTSHRAQGVAVHPTIGNTLFFNQAHLFHASGLTAAQAAALTNVLGRDRLPRHARFGDGSEISATEFGRIRAALQANELVFAWQPGDVLLLDNMQYCHGRRSFEGRRRVFAALMEPEGELALA